MVLDLCLRCYYDAYFSFNVWNADWEAIADREPNDLLVVPSECLSELSKLSVEDKRPHGPKRRGRGTFSYRNHELYSDQLSDDLAIDEENDEHSQVNSEENAVDKHCKSQYVSQFPVFIAEVLGKYKS